MAIQVCCPNRACRNHACPSSLPDHLAGKEVGCKACGLVLTVPEPRTRRGYAAVLSLAGIAVVALVAVGAALFIALSEDTSESESIPQAASLPNPFENATADKLKVATAKNQDNAPIRIESGKSDPPPSAAPSIPEPKIVTTPAVDLASPTSQISPAIPERRAAVQAAPTPVRAPAAAEPRFIIPFEAVAPVAKLDKIKVTQIEGRFSFESSPTVNPVTMTWQSIARFKWHEKASTVDIAFLVDGNRGWLADGRKVKPMEPDGFSFYQSLAYAISLSNLIPLRDKGFDVVKGEDFRVRGRDCFLVRVKAQGRPEMKMFFDAQTGFLAKAEFRGRFFNFTDLQLQKDATLLENYFSNYRKSDGVNHWRRYEQYRNGKKYAELNLDRVEFFEKVDDRWFALEKINQSPLRVSLPANDFGRTSWRITRVLPDKKGAATRPALQVTVMFTTPQQPARAGKAYRLVDDKGQVLDRAALRFTSAARRYGTFAFERILNASPQAVDFDGVFLEDDQGLRAPLQLGATARTPS